MLDGPVAVNLTSTAEVSTLLSLGDRTEPEILFLPKPIPISKRPKDRVLVWTFWHVSNRRWIQVDCSLLIAHCSLLIAHCSLLIGSNRPAEPSYAEGAGRGRMAG